MDYMRISFTAEKILSHKILYSVSSDHERMLMRFMYSLFMCLWLLRNQGMVLRFDEHINYKILIFKT